MPSEIPWSADTPQVAGRKLERAKARKYGANLHTNSGAGAHKDDFSTDETIFEDKNVARSHTISGEKLDGLLKRALAQGKDAGYIIYFQDANVTLEGRVRRGS